jgi:hypothetical protein
VRVRIAVTTAHRLEDLGRLLRAVAAEYASREQVHLLVVDNDASGSSQPVVREHARGLEYTIHYVTEPGYQYLQTEWLRSHSVFLRAISSA